MAFVAAATAIAAAAAPTIGVWTAAQYAVAAISMHYANRTAKRRAGAANRLARQGREFDIRNTVSSRSLIVGRAAVGVERVVFRKTHGPNRELVTFIACFGAHEIDEVEDILFDGESIGNLALRDSDGWLTDPDSKFVRTTRRNVGSGGEQWPSAGGQIQAPTNAESVLSIAVLSGDYVIDLVPGTHYSVQTDGPVTTITVLSGSAPYTGLPYRVTSRIAERHSLVRAKVYKGIAAGERDLYAEAIPVQNPDPELGDPPEQFWTSAHLLKGQPRVSFTLRWDADVFGPIGMPEITFVVRGAKCYDFVNDTTAWTDNPALIAAWYLTRPEGFGASLSEIDSTLAIAAQNACDEIVPFGEDGSQNQPRYRCGGVIDVEANPIENLNDILGSMAGDAVPVGSSWDLYAGVAQTPIYTLTDKDLAGGPEEFRPDSGLGERVNCVRGTFVDASNGYIARDIVPYESAEYIAQDGGEKAWLDIALPMTTDPWAAQRIARLRLHQARNAATWTTTYNLGAYPVRAGQVVRCRHTEYGWDTMESGAGKRFSVMSRRMNASGDIELAMMETAASIYSWNYDEGKEPDPTPNTDFPDPTYVEPVTLHAPVSNATTYDEGTNGEKIPYVLLSWDALPPAVALESKRIEVEWKGSGELSFRTERLTPEQTSLKLRPVWGGMLISGSVRVINALGVSSEPAFFDHRASQDLPSNRQAVSANLLTNPTFKSGTTGWTLGIQAGATDNIYFRKPVTQIIRGVPTQVAIEQAGSENRHAILFSEIISVAPGRRYVAYAECIGSYAQTRAQVAFYRADSSWIGDHYGSVIPAAPAGASAGDPGSYRISEVFADAPPEAAMARLGLVKFGTISHTSSRADFYRPFFGEVPSGSTQRPPWGPGGLPSIDTSSLEYNAATDIYAHAVTDFTTSQGGGGPPGPDPIPIVSFTPTTGGEIEVTISAECVAQALSSTPVGIVAWVSGSGVLVKPGQPNPQDNRVTILMVPGNDTAVGSFTVSGTFSVTAGVPMSIALWIGRAGKPSSVPVSGTVPKPINTGAGANINIRGIAARITHVKR